MTLFSDSLVRNAPPRRSFSPMPDTISDKQLIDLFLRDMRRRGYLNSTTTGRRTRLLFFASEMPRERLSQVTREDVQRWLDSRHIAMNTRAGWLSSISGFYEWGRAAGYLASNPVAEIDRPRRRRSLPRPMPDEDLRRALDEAPSQMVRCWVALGAYAGLRCQEIAGLEVEDILTEQSLIRVVNGKGAKERMVPLNSSVLSALTLLPMPGHGPIFSRPRGGSYPPWQLSQELNAYLHGLGIASTAHSLRHWFGTWVYRMSHDIRLVQELMGHESPQTTAIYTEFDQREAAPYVEKLSGLLSQPVA